METQDKTHLFYHKALLFEATRSRKQWVGCLNVNEAKAFTNVTLMELTAFSSFSFESLCICIESGLKQYYTVTLHDYIYIHIQT